MIQDKESLLEAVREKIKEANSSGQSFQKISNETGISRQHLNFIVTEYEGRKPSFDTLFQLADFFGVKYKFEGPKKNLRKAEKIS